MQKHSESNKKTSDNSINTPIQNKATETAPFEDNRAESIQMQEMQGKMQQHPTPIQDAMTQFKQAQNGIQEPAPTVQRQENKTGMPDQLKSGIENLSGMDMSDVKVHYNSDQPAQLNAHAYAQGTDIHIASGQEKYLPHEAWHVVQQKQGRVKPTMQMKGVNINNNDGLEKEADVMGEKALQRKEVNTTTPLLQLVAKKVVQLGSEDDTEGGTGAKKTGKEKKIKGNQIVPAPDRVIEVSSEETSDSSEDAKTKVAESKPSIPFRGIENSGTDCFIIAILQLLLHGQYMESSPFLDPILKELANGSKDPITKESIQDLRSNLHEGELVEAKESRHEDAPEFMGKILNKAKTNDITVTEDVKSVFNKEKATPIDYETNKRHLTEVKEFENSKKEHSSMIKVPVSDYHNLYDYLYKYYGKKGVTEKEDQKIEQDKKAYQTSERQDYRSFAKLPNILTFQLVRFEFDKKEKARKKIKGKFNMPETLILKEEKSKDSILYKEYHLKGVVEHRGESAEGGHYVAHIKNEDKWTKLNDKDTTQESKKDDRNSAYIYTYFLKKTHASKEVLPKDSFVPQDEKEGLSKDSSISKEEKKESSESTLEEKKGKAFHFTEHKFTEKLQEEYNSDITKVATLKSYQLSVLIELFGEYLGDDHKKQPKEVKEFTKHYRAIIQNIELKTNREGQKELALKKQSNYDYAWSFISQDSRMQKWEGEIAQAEAQIRKRKEEMHRMLGELDAKSKAKPKKEEKKSIDDLDITPADHLSSTIEKQNTLLNQLNRYLEQMVDSIIDSEDKKDQKDRLKQMFKFKNKTQQYLLKTSNVMLKLKQENVATVEKWQNSAAKSQFYLSLVKAIVPFSTGIFEAIQFFETKDNSTALSGGVSINPNTSGGYAVTQDLALNTGNAGNMVYGLAFQQIATACTTSLEQTVLSFISWREPVTAEQAKFAFLLDHAVGQMNQHMELVESTYRNALETIKTTAML